MANTSVLTVASLVAVFCCACEGPTPTSPTTEPTGLALSGTVTGYQGAALEGTTLEVLDGTNQGRKAVTDAHGSYHFTGLQPGGFTVQASAADYTPAMKPVTLTTDTAVDFQLQPRLAQIAIIGGILTFEMGANGMFSAHGQAVNTGDGCMADLTGTANVLDANSMIVATVFWSMPPNQILRPGDIYTYELCCLTSEQAAAAKTHASSFKWVTVSCS